MNYIEALQKRYSVKKFNPEKCIPGEILGRILDAGRLSASSLGMQPYEIFVISNPELRTALVPAFYNPSQISTCSHLIAIVSKLDISEDYIKNYFSHISATRDIPVENLAPFRKSIDHHISGFSAAEIEQWVDKQTYIVLGNMMMAAALENVDTCPMEGFSQQEIDKILNLDGKKEKVSVTLALGYAAEDDPFRLNKKVRKPEGRLFRFL